MIRRLSLSLFIMLSVASCGGGGSGAGQAGDKASLRVLNTVNDSISLSVLLDNQIIFPDVRKSQATAYKEIAAGAPLIEVVDNMSIANTIELISEFAPAIPYTLVVYGDIQNLSAMVAVNDRSDTPQGKFRIRSLKVRGAVLPLEVKLIPANPDSPEAVIAEEYTLLERGDYRLSITEGNEVILETALITFNPNQIETIVVSDLPEVISRLNDKP